MFIFNLPRNIVYNDLVTLDCRIINNFHEKLNTFRILKEKIKKFHNLDIYQSNIELPKYSTEKFEITYFYYNSDISTKYISIECYFMDKYIISYKIKNNKIKLKKFECPLDFLDIFENNISKYLDALIEIIEYNNKKYKEGNFCKIVDKISLIEDNLKKD